jgi:hypothetical protein
LCIFKFTACAPSGNQSACVRNSELKHTLRAVHVEGAEEILCSSASSISDAVRARDILATPGYRSRDVIRACAAGLPSAAECAAASPAAGWRGRARRRRPPRASRGPWGPCGCRRPRGCSPREAGCGTGRSRRGPCTTRRPAGCRPPRGSPSPQQYASPLTVSPHTCESPSATSFHRCPTPPRVGRGIISPGAPSPSPNWPISLSPQQYSSFSGVMAQVASRPASIC